MAISGGNGQRCFIPAKEKRASPRRARACPSHLSARARLWFAEINNTGEEAGPNAAQSAISTATSGGTWRLVRTPDPRGGPDAVSIMQTADAARSDMDLVGLTLRCSDTGFDILVVFL